MKPVASSTEWLGIVLKECALVARQWLPARYAVSMAFVVADLKPGQTWSF